MPFADIATVLVVEDDPLVRMHGTEILEEAGYEVVEACDADAALAILKVNNDVHLLFSDVDMPGSMDGIELAKIVYERWPHIHLLLTSGHHRLADAQMPGRGLFVRKPWTSEVLLARLQDFI